MITDDERRRAAARLREVQSDVIPGTKTEVHPIAGRIIGVACGYDLPDFQGLLGRLADLIEPDTTSDTTKSAEDTTKTPTSSDTAPTSSDASATHTDATATCDTSQGCRDTVACDREALLALADECDSVHMHKVARRIREACGVVA